MKLYFSPFQVPELAGLTRRRRKLVFQCALEAFYHEQPAGIWMPARWLFGGILTGALGGGLVVIAGGFPHWRWLIVAAGAVAGLLAGNFIATQFHAAQLRPYFRRVLEERKDEILKIN